MIAFVPQAFKKPRRKHYTMWPTASLVDYDHAMNRLNSVDRLGLPYGLPWLSTGKRGSEGGQVKIKLALVREKKS